MRRMPRPLRALLAGLLLTATVPAAAQPTSPDPGSGADLIVFVRDGCPHCADAEEWIESGLLVERPSLDVEIHDVAHDPAALARLREIAATRGMSAISVPTFVIGERVLVGFDSGETTGAQIRAMLARATTEAGETAAACAPVEEAAEADCQDEVAATADGPGGLVSLPLIGVVDIGAVGLPLFTVAIGLLDGFNPCAMWVLLFLLSILVNLKDRRKMFLIGGIFILVSGIVYFAFMAAWLNVFVLIGYSRTLQLALGGVAILIGALNVKDFFWLGSGPSVGIPDRAKPGIYARTRKILTAERVGAALGTVVVLAFLVNTVELLCTAGLPALYTQILSLRELSWWQYYGYLAMYNVFYMLDDAMILTVAIVTLSHHRLQQGEARWLKLVAGVAMLSLGLVLALKPGWLVL